MNRPPKSPHLGFDRFISLEWVSAAMKARAGVTDRQHVLALLQESGLSPSAQKRALTILNRQWLAPRTDLVVFCDQGATAWTQAPQTPVEALAWGVTLVAYPFFAKVGEVVGRLTALQGDCRSAEVHRRIAEVYGQRDAVRRATNAVLQAQTEWGLIDRHARGQCISRRRPIRLADERIAAWLIEAGLRYAGRAMPAASVGSLAVLFPFQMECPIAMLLPHAPSLELRAQGVGEQLIDVRDRSYA